MAGGMVIVDAGLEVKLDLVEASFRFCRGWTWSSATITRLSMLQILGGGFEISRALADLLGSQEGVELSLGEGEPVVCFSEGFKVPSVIEMKPRNSSINAC